MAWIASHVMDCLAAGFALLAAAHLLAPRALRASVGPVPRGFRRVTGILFAVAAGLTAFPPTRFIGLGVAALVLFLSATTFLHRRQYGIAASVIVALFTLIPVSLAAAAQ